ncbi:hypothetical protein [Marinirhabdus gelatinilytica]|uniref:Uncharacterized protein n=1 Tax=Marinirhabdus gelatinilytica TaxID=1703343 RepID=A0A370Q2E1_9FLAO|nr:hypothetical protein [Marinirhabdus gelatinilytica]RDK82538.1 hypothetical protein C8D94_1191 [Marinirhabdus gelatinilytica]
MTRVIKFLTDLDDYELAYFAKFKLKTYMPETQSEINKYIADKGLTEQRIEKLIATNPKRDTENGKIRCPRCSTDKIRTEKVEWTNNTGQFGLEDEISSLDGLDGRATYKDQVICNVCGFWIKDPNFEKKKKSFWHYIADGIFNIFTGWY